MATVRPAKLKSKSLATIPYSERVPYGAAGLRVRRFLAAAMEQQMWFFGCDAACADGNLLVRYGFQRYRREVHAGGSSSYRFLWRSRSGELAPDAQVDLHGWCAGLHPLKARRPGEGGFLYVRARSRVGWYDAPSPPVPGEYDEVPEARRTFHPLGRDPEAGFCQAAAWFLDWVEEYERWIATTCGPSYRERCYGRAPLPWLPPSQGSAWLAAYRRALLSLSVDYL